MKNSSNNLKRTEKIFVIFTDVVDSCKQDKNSKSNFIEWRKDSFFKQLHKFLVKKEREVIKSVGDALFVKSTFTGSPSKLDVEYLLKGLVDIFQECKKDKAVRITIHCLDKQYEHGVKLAEALEGTTLSTCGNKSVLSFINGLRSDLFGTDINKAARIQGLAKKPTILVTEDVVKLLKIKADCKSHEFNGCKLHHPVPVTYLKGIFDYSEKNKKGVESKKYIKVWELSSSNADNNLVLSQESKQFHVLRFLNAVVDFTSPDDDTPENRSNVINEIYKEANSKIFEIEERKELQQFHTDIKYIIHDIFRFSKIDFTRPSSNKSCASPFDNFKEFRKIKNTEIVISSLLNTLKVTGDSNGKLNCTMSQKKFPNKTLSFIPYLLLASFPNQETASKLRSIYSYKASEVLGSDKVKIIEPQTIQLYKHVNISNSKEESRVSNELNILLFFGVYNEHIDAADEEKLYSQCEISLMEVFAKGILSGLVDGFIIYKTSRNTMLKDISQILNKLFAQNSTKNKSFFDYVFPISIFTISAEKVNESNIKILKMVKTNYK